MRRRPNRRKWVVGSLSVVLFVSAWLVLFYHHVGSDFSVTDTLTQRPNLPANPSNFPSSPQPVVTGGRVGDDEDESLECPSYNPAIEALQIPLKHLPRKKKTSVAQKYDRRAHNCAGNGIWNRVTIDDHKKILRGIVRIAGIRAGAKVLDWGSGCGHSLHILAEDYNTRGVGIDVSNLTIAYARANTSSKNMHCVADGTQLGWIPDNYFDHAISFGSIYHVYNRTMFCHVLRQLVRIVRSKGTVYNGWTENAEFKRDHVGMCLDGLPVSFDILEEKNEFADVPIFPLKSQQNVPNTYSLRITKLRASKDSDDGLFTLEGCPIRCGVHKCETVVRSAVVATKDPRVPRCPPVKVDELDALQIPLEHLPRKKKTSVSQKYDRRAHNCAGNGIWHAITIKDHEDILETVGGLIQAKRGDLVFDWGAGCGHQLEFLTDKFGTAGLGIDVSRLSVAYALENTTRANEFCVADGSKLEWIPDATFDSAMSFGSIYHVYNQTLFCSVLQQLVRITKPGGFVYNGWTEDTEYPRSELTECINGGGGSHKVQILDEGKVFAHVAHFPLKAKRRSPNTYSLLVHVGAPA